MHGANMGSTWVLSAPDGPHVDPMNLALKDTVQSRNTTCLSGHFILDRDINLDWIVLWFNQSDFDEDIAAELLDLSKLPVLLL